MFERVTHQTRRDWLRAAAALALAPATSLANDDAGWIDAHVHIWTPDTAAYPLDSAYTVAAMQPPSFTPEELLTHARPAGVRRIVLIQMSFYGTDNRYMTDMIARHKGVFSGVGIVDHRSPHLVESMKSLFGRGVRGLRLHPKEGEAATWVRDPSMATLWNAARNLGIAVCPLINPLDIPAVDAMTAKFPGVRVVVDHFARIGVSGTIEPDHLENLLKLARFPDVHVKVSAFYALGKKKPPHDDLLPMIRRLVDKFGPDRLMWATDCPYQVQDGHTYAESLALIKDRCDFLSPADKTKILRTTAERVFFS